MKTLTTDISLKVGTVLALAICAVGTVHVLKDTQKRMYDNVMRSMCTVSYEIQRAISTGINPHDPTR